MEGNISTQCYAHFGYHYLVEDNKVDDSYADLDLSHQLDSPVQVVVGNMVCTTDGSSLVVVDMGGDKCGDWLE